MSVGRISLFSTTLILLFALSVGAQQNRAPQSQQPAAAGYENRMRVERFRHRGMRSGKHSLALGQQNNLRKLNLTDEQRQQRHAILQRHFDALKNQRDQLFPFRQTRMERSLTAEDRQRATAMRQQFRESMEGLRIELRNALTTEQRAQSDELREQRKLRREELIKRREVFRKPTP
jgi:Spy/CpxP family protein refolding chaperone